MIKRKRFLTLLAAAGLMAAGVSLAVPASADTVARATSFVTSRTAGQDASDTRTIGPDGGTIAAAHELKNVNSEKCLDVEFGGFEDFNRVTQYTCHGGPAQLWTLGYLGNDVYTLKNLGSLKCLEVGFGGKSNFNGVNQYTCHNGPGQQWKMTNVGNGAYTWTNMNSGKCLEVGFGGKSDFNGVNQYTCYTGPVQQWILL